MSKAATLAYLAGAMDSDGCISVKRSTYAMRVRGDAGTPVFSERVIFKQVTPEIPTLLKELFGGSLRGVPRTALLKTPNRSSLDVQHLHGQALLVDLGSAGEPPNHFGVCSRHQVGHQRVENVVGLDGAAALLPQHPLQKGRGGW